MWPTHLAFEGQKAAGGGVFLSCLIVHHLVDAWVFFVATSALAVGVCSQSLLAHRQIYVHASMPSGGEDYLKE